MNANAFQFLSAFMLSLSIYQGSSSLVWPSYVSPFLKTSTILNEPFTDTHMALLGSVPMLGCFASTLYGGLLWERLGRKYSMVFGALLFVTAWTIISTTSSINLILVARLLDGMAGGLNMALASMTIGEISLPRIRGVLTTIPTFMFNAGAIVSYVLGWLLSYQTICLINLSFSVVIVCVTLTLKESPVYLVQKGKEKEALQSLRFYRGSSGSDKELEEEIANIRKLIGSPYELAPSSDTGTVDEKPEKDTQVTVSKGPETKSPWVLLFTTPASRRALFTLIFLFVGLVFMGTIAVTTYAGTFFMRAVPSMSPHFCSIILGAANICGSMVSMSITDRLGRRVLVITSTAMVCGCLSTLASLLAWSWAPDWVIPVIILVSCFCLQLGAGPVPGILVSEYFTPEVKTLGTSISFCLMWIANFILVAVFNTMVSRLGLDGTFLTFALVAGTISLVSFFVLPETSGLTTEEIQEVFTSRVLHFRPRELNDSKRIDDDCVKSV